MSQFAVYNFLNWALRLSLAQGVIFLFLILSVVSLSLPHAGDLKPFFLLIAVYYWGIYRPTVMPIPYTFVLGLLLDFLGELHPGTMGLILVLLQIIVRRSRVFLMGQPYIMVWLGFAVLCILYSILLWVILSLSNFSIFPLSTLFQVLIAAGLTILIFPIGSLLLQSIHRLLPETYNPVHIRG
jgi:rod shape-determining protein MreD